MDNSIIDLVADLREKETLEMVQKELDAGTDPVQILRTCQKGLEIVGDNFAKGTYFISELMMAGEIFRQIGNLIGPLAKSDSDKDAGKVIIGTVKDDIHDIGKDLVVSMIGSAGFEVTDLGVDVPKERFIAAIRETGATVVGLSGLLTVAFDSMKETIAAIDEAGLRPQVKIMVGGGPVNEEVCKYTKADGWGNDALVAVNLCKEWIAS